MYSLIKVFLILCLPLFISSHLQAKTITSSKSLKNSVIFGYYPYMDSIGTLIYRTSDDETGDVDENGKPVPTVGSRIGFYDFACGNKIGKGALDDRVSSHENNYLFRYFYTYKDFDGDECDFNTVHDVEWFIIDTPDISKIKSWDEIKDRAISINKNYPEAIIPGSKSKNIPYRANLIQQSINNFNATGDGSELIFSLVTSSLIVPKQALNKYIGVKYTPKSVSGVPRQGKPVEMWDLNYFYGQMPPSTPGVILSSPFDLTTVQLTKNFTPDGSGGGKVKPLSESPIIENLNVSGIMAPGQKLKLDYRFKAYPISKPSSESRVYDGSIFFWGNTGTTSEIARKYDYKKSLAENIAALQTNVIIKDVPELDITLKDVGNVFELSILPIRKPIIDPFPKKGAIVTYPLQLFDKTITPLKKPTVSQVEFLDTPELNKSVRASYKYTPSNSKNSYNASYYKWSLEYNYPTIGIINFKLKEGFIKTDPNNIPSYDEPIAVPDSGILSTDNSALKDLTDDIIKSSVLKLEIEAVDAMKLTGNSIAVSRGFIINDELKNSIQIIKPIYHTGTEGFIPFVEKYGEGFPTIGFVGATFRLYPEKYDYAENVNNWTWKVVEMEKFAKVDNAGGVTLIGLPPKDSVIRVTATNKANPKIQKHHSFTIKKWLISIRELTGGQPRLYTQEGATKLCANLKRRYFSKAQLPTLFDLTAVPSAPGNQNISNGFGYPEAGNKTKLKFPSESVYSQWGELINYNYLSMTGNISPEYTFPAYINKDSNRIPYVWTSSRGTTYLNKFSGALGYGDWMTSLSGDKYNAFCIVYDKDFTRDPNDNPLDDLYPRPEPNPDPEPEPEKPGTYTNFAGIKLERNYPKNSQGFPRKTASGDIYPTLAFNGASFLLFPIDGPGSNNFVSNNTVNNQQFQWRVAGQPNATEYSPSHDNYILVTNKGLVTFINEPPKGHVYKIIAEKNGSQVFEHVFKLKKWYAGTHAIGLGSNIERNQSLSQSMCNSVGFRLPKLKELSDMPPNPSIPSENQGSGIPGQWGESSVYTFPSDALYSQWGSLSRYSHVQTSSNGGLSYQYSPFGKLKFWSNTAGVTYNTSIAVFIGSNWGDWIDTSNGTNLNFICVKDL